MGVIDSGIDLTHPGIKPNLNMDLSCSFIFDDTPTALTAKITNGDCSNKAAVQRPAQQLECPPNWQPLGPNDEREQCYGNNGRTSFFGHGLVEAAAAAQE